MSELITYHKSAHHKIILIDEPENSLHADAQHLLREFLFDLTADGRTQVIYSTHSPCMVNPMRSEQVRVLYRHKTDKAATTKLLPRPADANFLGLRTSLGMSASDSLLFAPVTIVTEGDTEVRCLPNLILKLELSGKAEFSKAKKLLGLVNFLDGEGNSFEHYCRLAKAHGARVVLFLDGDKRREVEQSKFREKHVDVPVLLLPEHTEFEQLVPASIYLKALSEITGINLESAEAQLKVWVAEVSFRENHAFSKKIEGWFRDTYAVAFPPKPTLMRKALELCPIEQINSEPIRQLLGLIQEQLSKTSFT